MTVERIDPSRKLSSDKTPFRALRTTVLHLCPDLEPGDPARSAVDLAILTQRAGWRSLMASGGGLLVADVERAAVRHTRMPLGHIGTFASWRNRLQLSSLIQKEQPVLLHAHGFEAAYHAVGPARTNRIPLVADFSRPLPDKPYVRRFLHHLDRTTSAVRVPSEFMARNLAEVFRWPQSRLQVIPPGVDTQVCHAGSVGPERLQTLSRLWRLPEQGVIIVAPAPFIQGGGHRQLLDAVVQLKRDDVFVVLVGDNRHTRGVRAEIEEHMTRLGLAGKVIMPDYCTDWPAAFWLSNVIVAPTTVPRGQAWELLVAQAIGRPVIVTDCGAHREMVSGGQGSWIVPPDDVDALANALREVAALGTQRRLELAQEARVFVTEYFPQTGWFNSMMDLYDSLRIPSAQRMHAEAA